MTTSYIITGMIFIMGILFGFILGWGAGKERTRSLLNGLIIKMNYLRETAKIKGIRRTNAYKEGQPKEGERLDNELAAESQVFLGIQEVISEWCHNNNEGDPFVIRNYKSEMYA